MGRVADQIDAESVKILADVEQETDGRVSYAAIKRRIDALQTAGEIVPQALVVAQRQLMTDLIAESQGR
jgi:hypothetical protein